MINPSHALRNGPRGQILISRRAFSNGVVYGPNDAAFRPTRTNVAETALVAFGIEGTKMPAWSACRVCRPTLRLRCLQVVW
jgi:hypothetical protein